MQTGVRHATDRCRYKAQHSASSIAVVDTLAKLKMFADFAAELPKLRAVVVWAPGAGVPLADMELPGGRRVRVLSWENLVGPIADAAIAAAVAGVCETIDSRIVSQQPGHVCAYIYTCVACERVGVGVGGHGARAGPARRASRRRS